MRGGEEMEKEKPLRGAGARKVTFTLRLPIEIHADIQQDAKQAGVSLNDFILLMVAMGRRVYREASLPAQAEFPRAAPQSLK